MKKLLAIILLLWAASAYCQPQLVVDSTRFITGNKCCTDIRYAIPTSDKGLLFVGAENNNPGGIIPYFPTDTGVNMNVFIGKLDSNKQISWLRIYGGTEDDIAFSACETHDGGFAVLAHTESVNGNVTGYKGGGDLWLLRLDLFGNLMWQRIYGSSESDVPASIACTPDKGFIILGYTNGSDGDVPLHYGSAFSEDWLVIKTDNIGTVQWSRDLGGTGEDGGYSSILSIDSSFYLINGSASKDHDCTDTAWHTGIPTTYGDGYVLKLDWSGNVLWDSSYGGSENDGFHNGFFDVRDSSLVMCGFTYSHDFMVSDYHGGIDMWVLKINKNGTLLWKKTLGTINDDVGWSICPDHDSGYMVYGTTRQVVGGGDCWVSHLSKEGNEIERKIFDGTDNENAASIFPFANGYATSGGSASSVFTEGTSYGNFSNGGAFVSYLSYRPVGIENVAGNNATMQLYPNPATTTLNVVTGNSTGNLTIRNILGQVVFNGGSSTAGTTQININSWPAGLYLVNYTSADGNIQTQKLIKN